MEAHIDSLKNKALSYLKQGLNKTERAKAMGEYYANNYNAEIEKIAEERYDKCKHLIIEEPVKMLRVEDKVKPKWSGKIFKDCGCPISYKLRQTIINCKCWE